MRLGSASKTEVNLARSVPKSSCCALSVVRCPLSVAKIAVPPLRGVRCQWSAAWCPLSVVRCVVSVVRCPLQRLQLPLRGVGCQWFPLRGVRCQWSVVRCKDCGTTAAWCVVRCKDRGNPLRGSFCGGTQVPALRVRMRVRYRFRRETKVVRRRFGADFGVPNGCCLTLWPIDSSWNIIATAALEL